MSEAGAQEAVSGEIERQASVYVFPGLVRPPYPTAVLTTPLQPPPTAPVTDISTVIGTTVVPTVPGAFARGDSNDEEAASRARRRPPFPRTHARSASHGGVLAESLANTGLQGNTGSYLGPLSAVGGARPSALKKPGHQRAFSQGQVVDVQGHSVTGHSRVGSRTDFILPPGHREEPRPPTAGKTPSFRGHSRQASRSESIYTIRRSAEPPWWRRLWARCFGPLPEEPRLRTIVPNHLVPPKTPPSQHPNGRRVNNRVRTTKYTMLSFLPRNLLEQFHRVANLYFIFIVLLNWVPAINAFGKEVAMIPVIFVLGVTALKDYFEDRRRLASDRRVNNSTCRVYVGEDDRYAKVAWKDVKVGDLVHLSNNELVPADVLLLRSSDPQGLAYIDTCNLDGETNLKQRQVVRGFIDLQDTFQPAKFRSVIEVDQPSTRIYRFHGAVVHPNGGRVPVSTENLLLRECLLKNTDFVEGIVIYAGHETKAMLNNGGPRYKRSRLEKQMNRDVIWCVVILLLLCVIGAIGCRLWLSGYSGLWFVPFIPVLQEPSYESMLTFWTFVIILQVMIPLSLYVTIEMAKVGQVYHIGHDVALYDTDTDRSAECRALNITEELGQVQYIFSDKTGTLTENKMLFRRCAVGGQDYSHTGEGENLLPSSRLKEDLIIGTFRQHLQEFLVVLAICNTVVVNSQPHYDTMNSSGVIEEPQKNGDETGRYTRMIETRSLTPSPVIPLSTLSHPVNSLEDNVSSISSMVEMESVLNNSTKLSNKLSRPRFLNVTSIPSLGMGLLGRKLSPNGAQKRRSPLSSVIDGSGKNGDELLPAAAIYEAESPDELALVNAARAYDVKLLKRTARSAIVCLPDKSILTFEILHVLPFDSNRKCMSVLVRHPLTNEVVLYSKGADSTIFSSLTSQEENSIVTMRVRQHLQSYARQGLRTLVMAKKSLTAQEYETWRQTHTEAELAMENREHRLKDSYANLESHLTLLGATGIEDKLQAGVPETMATLMAAGIVIWVLTGDKPETAVNIAYSARLFSPAMQLLWLQARSKSVAEALIHGYLETARRESAVYGNERGGMDNIREIAMFNRDAAENEAHRIGSPWPKQRALVVDGKTLTVILDPRSGLTRPFLELTKVCSSVLACRATPLQKSYIVRIVKEQLGMRTLAIGDGANDVSMIQTADVGVGISGHEGTQAVMAADFAISRFSMLSRLLLLHGHWCYDRLSRMILYFFYKNATFVFLVFWFQMYCGFTGTVMVDQIYLMLYNLMFTSMPPLALGVYDRVASPDVLMSMPHLYKRGRLGLVYQPHSFWLTMADALYQSIVIFFVNECVYYDSTIDIWEFGTTVMTCCIVVMLAHVSIEIRSWTIIHVFAILGSLSVFFGFCLIYNIVCVNCMGLLCSYWVMEMAIVRYTYWLTVILTCVLALLPRLLYKTIKWTISPDLTQTATFKVQSKTGSHRQRIAERSENNFIAGWSRSTQHATIS
ncbi:PREDICTED: probable phospholipid-transporting ATPase VD isoform X2 [Dufourea novaeangliae]|uniref:probable phospholipid-transporting ATPase VD isoform X2 n=1 Tax=Dufourea novaeangliae TaxID=178035 RepID=UPI000766F0E8|nr:PREDICTED: probable phospholipid-transporting ATPase VD isoform X2 [Dufourea novaeangliae]